MNVPVDADAMRRQLKEAEAYMRYAYRDSLGYLTVAVGRCVDARLKGEGITPAEADYLLDNDIEQGADELTANVGWWLGLSEVRRRVLLDMWFNMGLERIEKFRNTLAAVQRGDWVAAAAGMRNSLWYRQVGARAERLARMMETGVDIPKWW